MKTADGRLYLFPALILVKWQSMPYAEVIMRFLNYQFVILKYYDNRDTSNSDRKV
jgi:hypothetical protein